MTKEYSDYLAHYGVKGQKWGVRNWQNEDGTYTDAGKNHYGWGYGYQNRGSGSANATQSKRIASSTRSNVNQDKENIVRQEQDEATRKVKTRNIILAAAGVSIAALAAYKGGKALKSWVSNNRSTIASLSRQKANMAANRLESKSVGGWSKIAEQHYRKNIRKINRNQWKALLGKRYF